MSISAINSPEHQKHTDGLVDALSLKATVEKYDPAPRMKRDQARINAKNFEIETGEALDKIAEGLGVYPLRGAGEPDEPFRDRIRQTMYPEELKVTPLYIYVDGDESEGGTQD